MPSPGPTDGLPAGFRGFPGKPGAGPDSRATPSTPGVRNGRGCRAVPGRGDASPRAVGRAADRQRYCCCRDRLWRHWARREAPLVHSVGHGLLPPPVHAHLRRLQEERRRDGPAHVGVHSRALPPAQGSCERGPFSGGPRTRARVRGDPRYGEPFREALARAHLGPARPSLPVSHTATRREDGIPEGVLVYKSLREAISALSEGGCACSAGRWPPLAPAPPARPLASPPPACRFPRWGVGGDPHHGWELRIRRSHQ